MFRHISKGRLAKRGVRRIVLVLVLLLEIGTTTAITIAGEAPEQIGLGLGLGLGEASRRAAPTPIAAHGARHAQRGSRSKRVAWRCSEEVPR